MLLLTTIRPEGNTANPDNCVSAVKNSEEFSVPSGLNLIIVELVSKLAYITTDICKPTKINPEAASTVIKFPDNDDDDKD